MALTDTEDFFRLSVIAMPKRRSIFDFREQRAKQPCLHGYLAAAARAYASRSGTMRVSRYRQLSFLTAAI